MNCLIRRIFYALCWSAIAPSIAGAFEPVLPLSARLTAERASIADSFEAPVAGFDGNGVPSVSVEGAIQRRSWRIDTDGLTPLQVLLPLRQQLEAEEFELTFECDASACGGFDFRFDIEVLPGPNMYVNISRFRYLTAMRGDPDAPTEVVGILASVTDGSAYVQVISALVGALPDAGLSRDVDEVVSSPIENRAAGDLESALNANGHVILEDLDFGTGSSDLGAGPFASLAQLAELLENRPTLRVALVGHTDTVGNLNTNIALSRARALSVRDRLIADFGVDPARLDAEGMGYLSPIAPNLSEAGRTRNRRVEAILLSE